MLRKTPGKVRARTCGTKSPSRSEALRFIDSSKSPSTVDGDLDESIKRSTSDRLGDLVPQVRARTFPGVFRDMALLGLCLELSFSLKSCWLCHFRQETDFKKKTRFFPKNWMPCTRYKSPFTLVLIGDGPREDLPPDQFLLFGVKFTVERLGISNSSIFKRKKWGFKGSVERSWHERHFCSMLPFFLLS